MSLRLLSTNHESPGFSRGERQSTIFLLYYKLKCALTLRRGETAGWKRQVNFSERHTFELKKESHNERKMEK